MKHKVDAAEDTAAARAAADHGEHARGRHRYWTVGRRPRRPRDWRATRRAARADRVLAWRSGGSTSRVPLFGTAVPFGTPAGSIFGATATGLYLSSFRREGRSWRRQHNQLRRSVLGSPRRRRRCRAWWKGREQHQSVPPTTDLVPSRQVAMMITAKKKKSGYLSSCQEEQRGGAASEKQ
jgi:hypothetical protein